MQIVMGVHAQEDTSWQDRPLDEVVVTATRSERLLSNVAIPATIISAKRIQQSGSVRLHDILAEQTGLFITDNFGKGIQMQGLSADYVLILLNGEPLVGRMGGVLDLSRITVGNIRKIEIIKGPSSALYGSEALAGVINIITNQSSADRLSGSLRYGRFQNIDASLQGSIRRGRFSGSGFINVNGAEGYSLLPNTRERTVEPFWRITGQYQGAVELSDATKLAVGLRINHEEISNNLIVQNLGRSVLSRGKEVNRDLNFTPVLSHRFSDRVKSQLRGYVAQFGSLQQLDVAEQAGRYDDRFRQGFYRLENQTDVNLGTKLEINAGAGYVLETVASNRYDSLMNIRYNRIGYLFLQAEWRPADALTMTGGFRYDRNRNYASVFSPKFAMRYSISEKISINGSVGRGFKAPDFRQLYLNFTNIAAGGYSVFGSLAAADELNDLVAAGQIESFTPRFAELQSLRPETSTGYHAGLTWRSSDHVHLKFNLFRNDMNNLILTDVVAFRKGGGQIFSYFNISRAFTQGMEWEGSWKKGSQEWQLGYQYLQTADKDVLEQIRQARVFMRDEKTGISRKMGRSEYAGLPQRSAHMANAKWFREWTSGWFSTVRIIWRSRWGTTDRDGNGVINRDDEFARGFAQVNISAGRQFKKGIRLMAGIDNLFNYRDLENLPGLPGYLPYISLSYDFLQPRKTKY